MEIIIDGKRYEGFEIKTISLTSLLVGEMLQFNGKKYVVYPIEMPEQRKELTLEDCVAKDYYIGKDGDMLNNMAELYQSTEIALKVFLYGLLQSVANKLNGDWKPVFSKGLCAYYIQYSNNDNAFRIVRTDYNYGIVYFKSSDLAQQAIDIFSRSAFDLKKLFQ